MKPLTVLISTMLLFSLTNCGNGNNENYYGNDTDYETDVPKEKSPEELRAELKALEQEHPMDYLTCSDVMMYPQQIQTRSAGWFHDAEYAPDGAIFKGKIYNSATLARFKDAKVTVKYYSETQTLIKKESYVIYKYLEPQSTLEFSFRTAAYPAAYAEFGFELIGASVARE